MSDSNQDETEQPSTSPVKEETMNESSKKEKDPVKQLIRYVKTRECLWNKNHKLYFNHKARAAAWNEIYRIFDPDYDDLSEKDKESTSTQIKKKWSQIRDTYMKGIKDPHKQTYPLFKMYGKKLSFLNVPNLSQDKPKQKKNKKLVVKVKSEKVLKEQSENEMQYSQNDSAMIDANGYDDLNYSQSESYYNYNYEPPNGVISMLNNLFEKEDDEDRAFFKSITPEVKRLSNESKLEFRIKVMNFLKELNTKDKKKK